MGEDTSTEEVFFNVTAKIEEQKKTESSVTLSFSLLLETKPNIARYSTTGAVILEGNAQDINKRLEVNPKTKIPQILFTVYQHVFSSIYLLSSILKTPYPPPDLLHPMQEKIQILSESDATKHSQTTQNVEAPAPEPATTQSV